MRVVPRTLIVALFLLVSGCISVPQKSFNRGAANIKTIHVHQMAHNEIAVSFPHPGLNFGLIGATVAIADLNAKGNKLESLVARSNFEFRTSFKESFDKAMRARGYTLTWDDPIAEPKKGGPKVKRGAWGLRKAYGPVADVDAQLDINLAFVGYAASGASDNAPYRPTVNLSAALVDASGKRVLFSDVVSYHNHIPALKKAISVEPDPAFAYQDFDALMAAGEQAAEGLDRAIRASAETMARQL